MSTRSCVIRSRAAVGISRLAGFLSGQLRGGVAGRPGRLDGDELLPAGHVDLEAHRTAAPSRSSPQPPEPDRLGATASVPPIRRPWADRGPHRVDGGVQPRGPRRRPRAAAGNYAVFADTKTFVTVGLQGGYRELWYTQDEFGESRTVLYRAPWIHLEDYVNRN